MSKEMEAFDRLPYNLRRAIDEAPYGVSALLTEAAIRRGRTTADAATARIRGFQGHSDAREFFHQLQRWIFGRVERTLV